ncbi:hypothetical protein [Limnospira platensis]|uniref:hypothetical protein n=1 Tax=Limnospira platensis TaxID=118562 RepID=UPI003396318A
MSSELEEIITEGNLGEQLESVLRAVCVLPYPSLGLILAIPRVGAIHQLSLPRWFH